MIKYYTINIVIRLRTPRRHRCTDRVSWIRSARVIIILRCGRRDVLIVRKLDGYTNNSICICIVLHSRGTTRAIVIVNYNIIMYCIDGRIFIATVVAHNVFVIFLLKATTEGSGRERINTLVLYYCITTYYNGVTYYYTPVKQTTRYARLLPVKRPAQLVPVV